MNDTKMMGYLQALNQTLDTIVPLKGSEEVELEKSLNRVVFSDLHSLVDSPSIHASMKDGYALRSEDITAADLKHPVPLRIIGSAAAGSPSHLEVSEGTAVRILTGAEIPQGADAVLAEEFTHRRDHTLTVFNTAAPGRNILARGADVQKGELIASKGTFLNPGKIGTIAASGFGRVPVFFRPRVAILATGDELVKPGCPLPAGKLYASNLEMLKSWCRRYGIPTSFQIVTDRPDIITRTIQEAVFSHDAVITSGGAWTGDRDYVSDALTSLGWKKIFHSIRIGPGKPVGFGLLEQKPVFLLPGGPPSNLTGFLKIALPGLLRLGGHAKPFLPRIMVRMKQEVVGRQKDWTQFVYGTFSMEDGYTMFSPLSLSRRLQSMAVAQGVITIPEGVHSWPADTMVEAEWLF